MEEVTYNYKTCDRWWQPLLILLKPDTMHQRLKAILSCGSSSFSRTACGVTKSILDIRAFDRFIL